MHPRKMFVNCLNTWAKELEEQLQMKKCCSSKALPEFVA
jgi:hypothetical protein